MLVCGLDVESTGLGIGEDEIIEIGLVLWDTDKHKPLEMFSQLVKPQFVTVSKEITKITGILPNDVENYGIEFGAIINVVNEYFTKAEAIIGHNSTAFDKPFLEADCLRKGQSLCVKHWIDTSSDLPFPEKIKTRNLVHLAAEHGFLNPFAHRALFDVLTMLKVLSFYDFGKVLALSKEPSFVIQAMCEKPWEDGGKSTEEAKANGFRWDGKTKRWLKTIRESQRIPEMEKAKLYKIIEV